MIWNFVRNSLTAVVLIAVCVSAANAQEAQEAQEPQKVQKAVYSVILSGGTVYDGAGADGVRADVGLIGDRIGAIGDLSGSVAARRIDVTGLAVVPGFIDIHSHATSGSPESSDVVRRPLAESYVRQGVTTAMGGQDGESPVSIGSFLAYLDAQPSAINIGMFIGQGSIRGVVMGQESRKPTAVELAQMTDLVRLAMTEGAYGLSSGLEYTPGSYAEIDELIELAKPVGQTGGIYISHIRDEGARVIESIQEVIRIGEESGAGAQVTHHKVIGKGRWGSSTRTLGLIDDARRRGIDAMSDQYPYTASSTGLTILLPGWAKVGGSSELMQRLKDPETRARIRADVIAHINVERGADPSSIVAARCSNAPENDGMSLADILERDGQPISVEGAADVAMSLVEGGGCSGVFHSMSEEDVRRIMQHPFTMISSDGGIPEPGDGVPHPRNYGAFARVLGHYVREEGILTFAEAVRKMTSLPAERLGLDDRGRLIEGNVADITVLDPEMIADQARFGDPHHFATGVHHVFTSGQIVLLDGILTGIRPGKALRHLP